LLLSEAIMKATSILESGGVLSPNSDAYALAGFVLSKRRSEVEKDLALGTAIDSDQLDNFFSLVQRRATREPLQHITGMAPFRNIELIVGQGVFVPRPETEQVVQRAIDLIKNVEKPVVVDLCSGSGAIAISIATELEGSKCFAVELSKDAFAYLEKNFQLHQLRSENLFQGDLLDAFDELVGKVDLVVSNPPYIPNDAVPIYEEVWKYDPALALYGGEDGLDVIRNISKRSQKLLKSGGYLVLEHADIQAAAVVELLLADGWISPESGQDLTGRDRMVFARRP
jgi:release factor glutamine methyltransferase